MFTRKKSGALTKISLCLLINALILPVFSQKTYFGDSPVKWENNLPVELLPNSDDHPGADLVILSDQTQFYFYAANNEKIVRSLIFKINTEKGLEGLMSFKLPESFDEAYDANSFKQGRKARIKTTFSSGV
jgi:hypothetical protein